MNITKQFFVVIGAASLLAAVALGGSTFALQDEKQVHAVGDFTPDPCEEPLGSTTGVSEITAFGQDECVTPTEETPPRTHTPTPESTVGPTEPVPTDEPVTNTPVPPAPTSPSGGAGGGGVQPPNTGSNGDAGAAGMSWLLIAAGLILAAAGTGSLAFGLRRD
jgi:hypothetical protein